MYVSHRHKLIFVRPPKTAGTSTEQFLIDNLCDPDAIYSPDPYVNRVGSLADSITEKYLEAHEFKHMTLQQIVNEGIVTEDQANQYDVFCVIRNPIDRQLSSYFHMKRHYFHGDISLEDYRSISKRGSKFQGVPYSGRNQVDYLKLNGNIVGKFWLFENIQSLAIQYLESKGIKPTTMPKHMVFHDNLDLLLEDSDIEDLQSIYAEDFEIYGNLY